MTLTMLLALCAGCAEPPPAMDVCTLAGAPRNLPDEVRETSGAAIASFDAQTLWTHNDAGNTPYIYAIDGSGGLAARVRVTGAELEDWEDIERAPCADGTCLYIGDIGDNEGARESITVYVVKEPAAGDSESAPARAITVRYPDRAQDAEALFVHDGTVHLITKGRTGAIALYRFPAAGGVLERVREVMPQPRDDRDRVSSATLSEDGAWVLMRTYRTLYFFPAAQFVSGAEATPVVQDLGVFGERQGEAVAMAADGTVWLTSEAENRRAMPVSTRLQCTLPSR